MKIVFALAAALVLCCPAAAADNADIAVEVRKEGETIHVTVDCPVKAPAAVAWEVMTDYDNMAKFISNLTQSSVRMHMGNRMQVAQKGKASRGPLSISFETLREIELVPKTEVRSKVIAGDTMPAAFVTRIEERDGITHVTHVGSYTPSMWVLPLAVTVGRRTRVSPGVPHHHDTPGRTIHEPDCLHHGTIRRR